MTDRPDTLVDRILTRAKNHRVLSVLIIAGIVIIGVGKFVGAVKPIVDLFRRDTIASPKQSQPPIALATPANENKSENRNSSDTRSILESNSNTASNKNAQTINHLDKNGINRNTSPRPLVADTSASKALPDRQILTVFPGDTTDAFGGDLYITMGLVFQENVNNDTYDFTIGSPGYENIKTSLGTGGVAKFKGKGTYEIRLLGSVWVGNRSGMRILIVRLNS